MGNVWLWKGAQWRDTSARSMISLYDFDANSPDTPSSRSFRVFRGRKPSTTFFGTKNAFDRAEFFDTLTIPASICICIIRLNSFFWKTFADRNLCLICGSVLSYSICAA